MIKDLVSSIAAVCALGLASVAVAANLEDITNFHQYSAQLASAGQPTTKQLRIGTNDITLQKSFES